MSLPTSLARRVKEEVMAKIESCATVAKVYGFDRTPVEQFPSVFVKAGDMEGEFYSNAENRRIYSYRVLLLAVPLGQDIKNVTDDRMQYAEELTDQVVDEILNSIDDDYELGDYAQVLFVEALDVTYQEYAYEGGYAKGAEFSVRVHTDYNVT